MYSNPLPVRFSFFLTRPTAEVKKGWIMFLIRLLYSLFLFFHCLDFVLTHDLIWKTQASQTALRTLKYWEVLLKEINHWVGISWLSPLFKNRNPKCSVQGNKLFLFMFKTCSKSTHIFNHVIWARGHCGTKHQLHHFKIFSRLYNNVQSQRFSEPP